MCTTLQKTHMSACFYFRIIEGVFTVLLMKCDYPEGPSTWKPPSGGNDDNLYEDFEQTADREFHEEAGPVICEMIPLLGAQQNMDADPSKNRGLHTKVWFLVLNIDGPMRTGIKQEKKSVLGVPTFVPVKEALGLTGNRKIAGTHLDALRIAIKMYLDIYGRDQRVSESISRGIPQSFLV